MVFMRGILGIILFLPLLLWGQEAQEVLTLDDCIRIALQQNTTLTLATIDREIASKNYLQSYSNVLPQVNFSYSGSQYERGPTSYIGNDYIGVNPALPFTYQVTTGHNYYAEFRVSQNIFDGGRWWFNIKKSKLDRESSKFNYLSTRQNIIVTVRQLYIDLLKQEKLLKVKQQAVDRSKDQLEQVRSMYEVGSRAQIDVYRSEVNLGNDRIELLNQENAVREARQALNIALGRDPNAPLAIESNVKFEKEVGDLQQMLEEALQKNPEIKASELNVKSTRFGVRLAESAFLPNLRAFYFYQRRVPQFRGLYEKFDREYSWYVGISISWNLFNGFSDYLGVQKAKLNQRYAAQQLDDNRRNLKAKVTTLYHNLNSLNEIIKINEKNLESAREDYRLAQERYRLGSGTLLELRDAQLNLANAEQILVSAEYNAYITYAELQQALGKLVDSYQ